jgi:tetratricopeptide (TPR) repeat protein/mono/diheme cytochrome c family protein
VRVSLVASLALLIGAGAAVAGAAQRPSAAAPQTWRVTYYRDVAPLLADKCSACHRPGGGAPFALGSYPEVRRRATLIAQVTRLRTMPPWKPHGPVGLFAGDRRLADEQIAVIEEWVAAGAPEGEPIAGTSVSRPAADWELGIPDLIVAMPEPYLMPADGPDTIRTFVIPAVSSRDRYVRGIEFHPESIGVVHHANIKVDVTGSTRRIDAVDGEPGFDGSGPAAQFPDGQFLGWTPGQRPLVSEATAWALPAGADLVIELHMTPSGRQQAVQCRIGLLFTDVPPRRTPYMLRLSNQRLDIPAGASPYTSTDRYVLPVDVDVLAVQPHAHNLARAVTAAARLPDGRIENLIDIGDWDFRWQDVYRFTKPMRLPRGTALEMSYAYDNSERNPRNPFRPPRRITFGQTTNSEMGDVWLQVMTVAPDDRAALHRDFGPKMLRDDVAGQEMMVAAHPADSRIRRDLAYDYAAVGRIEDAVAELERSLELDRGSADGHFQLGTLLLNERRLSEAAPRLQRAVELEPGWADAHNNLGAVHLLLGDVTEATRAIDTAIALDPRSAAAHFNRGRLLARQGRPSDALAAYLESLRSKPNDPETLAALAAAYVATGDVPAAVRAYRDALQLQPGLVGALTDLAWILARSEPPDKERAEEAVRLAERAAAQTRDASAIVLDTLAASYLAAGRVDDAISTAERAMAVARAMGDAKAAGDIGARLETYRSRRR